MRGDFCFEGTRSARTARTLRRFLAAAALSAVFAVPARAARELVVTFLDCGQGDAALLETPGGKKILIDAGPVEPGGGFDAGREIVTPFLTDRGIKKIDVAVFSHAHLDHVGGYKYVLRSFPVGLILDPGYSYPSPDYKEVLDIIQERQIKYSVARAGDTLDWDPALKVRVLGPPAALPWDDPNDNSLVIHVQHGKVSFLFTGDIEEDAEYELVIRQGPSLKSTVLKVPHHGSTTSSKKEFLERVRPEVAVVSCGRFNRFRHPSKKVIARYEEDFGAKVYRTDTDGTVRVVSDGKKIRVETLGVPAEPPKADAKPMR